MLAAALMKKSPASRGLGAGLGAGVGALTGGVIGYGRPSRQRKELVDIIKGTSGLLASHPPDELGEVYSYGPFSEEHQELARKLLSQAAGK
jgi:hypothetical protein